MDNVDPKNTDKIITDFYTLTFPVFQREKLIEQIRFS